MFKVILLIKQKLHHGTLRNLVSRNQKMIYRINNIFSKNNLPVINPFFSYALQDLSMSHGVISALINIILNVCNRGSVPKAEYAPKLEYMDILVKMVDISELVDVMCVRTERCSLLAIE